MQRLVPGIAVDARGYERNRYGFAFMFHGQSQGIQVTVAKQLSLAMAAATPYRPDGVDYVLCREPACAGDDCLPHLAAADPVAFPLEFFRTCSSENSSAHSAAHFQLWICSVH